MFFSYAFTVIGILMVCVVILHYYREKPALVSIIKFAVVFVSVLIGAYVLLYLLSGFNQLQCLLHSIENNSNSMSGGFDNLKRYLLRSTGNIIAYLAGVGIPILAYSFYALRKSLLENNKNRTDELIIGTFLAIFIAGFSGLFFLETARIWILFTPFLCIAAGYSISQLPSEKAGPAIILTLTLTLLLSVSEELFIDHTYKYFSSGW